MSSARRVKITMGFAAKIALFAFMISAQMMLAQAQIQCYVCSSYPAFVTDPPNVSTQEPEVTGEPTGEQTTADVGHTDASGVSTEEPGQDQTSTAAPGEDPTSTAAPGEDPTSTAAPEADPTSTSAPDAEPTSTAAPQAEPTSTSAPEADPTSTAAPEDPTSTAGPEADPTSTAAAEDQQTSTSAPGGEGEEGPLLEEARGRRHPRSVAMASPSDLMRSQLRLVNTPLAVGGPSRDLAMQCGQPGGEEDALGTLRPVAADETCFVFHQDNRDGDVVIRGVEKTDRLLTQLGMEKEGCISDYVSAALDGRKFYVCACRSEKCNRTGRNSATRAAASGGMGALWAAAAIALAAGSKRSSLF